MANAATLQQQMWDAVLALDFGKLRDLYHPDYTYESSDGEKGGIAEGVAVAEMYMGAFPDMTFELRHQYSTGENGPAITELTAKGTHNGPLGELPPTGKYVEVLLCNIVESKDGQIIREREYYDSLSLMRQLGVAE